MLQGKARNGEQESASFTQSGRLPVGPFSNTCPVQEKVCVCGGGK